MRKYLAVGVLVAVVVVLSGCGATGIRGTPVDITGDGNPDANIRAEGVCERNVQRYDLVRKDGRTRKGLVFLNDAIDAGNEIVVAYWKFDESSPPVKIDRTTQLELTFEDGTSVKSMLGEAFVSHDTRLTVVEVARDGNGFLLGPDSPFGTNPNGEIPTFFVFDGRFNILEQYEDMAPFVRGEPVRTEVRQGGDPLTAAK
ncbi:MAG: hypothetical protein ABIE94_04625 [archaeon]